VLQTADARFILLHEDEALASLPEHVEMHGLVRVQAQQHRLAVVAQSSEEIKHEADVAVLRVELRPVEQMP
jgi:hypothetical protein